MYKAIKENLDLAREIIRVKADFMGRNGIRCLVDGGEDSMFWASKLHFYKTSISFYNYPYTFGYLFSSAVYNMFKQQGESFLPKYEEFLRQSGSGSVEDVSSKVLNINIQDPKFWSEAIQALKEPLDTYRNLLQNLKKCQ